MALSEQNIIDSIFSLYETDDDGWGVTSSEYLTVRVFINAGLKRLGNETNLERFMVYSYHRSRWN